jgi:DNA-binding transcriptional regulator YiaG
MKIKCDCGGTLEEATLRDVDLEPYLGLHARSETAPGLRCNRCGWETLPGLAVDAATHTAAMMLLATPGRLPAAHARFLRKFVGATQAELASRMGVTRKTVNEWENGRQPISPTNDLVLRALVFASSPIKLRQAAAELDHVRTAKPSAKPRAVVVSFKHAA